MRYLTSAVFIFFFTTISAQGYQKAFSAQGSDYVVMMCEDAGGNTWIAGTTSDTIYGYNDFFLVKINTSGDTIFTRTYGTPVYEYVTAACLTSDGGILLCGTSQDTSQCNLALKINSTGAVQWSKQFETAQYEEVASVIQTSDGGYLIYGVTYMFPAGVFLLKLNASGNLAWENNLTDGVSTSIIAGSVQEYSNGYAFTATHFDTSGDVFIGGVDFSGTLTWSSNLGLTNCTVTDFKSLGGGDFILGGYAENVTEVFLAKVNYATIAWAYTYTLPGVVYPEDIALDHDGNILMTGSVSDVFSDLYLLKTDSAGTKKWGMVYYENSFGISVSCATNGDYLLGGVLYDPDIQNGHLVGFALRCDTSGATGCGNNLVDGLTTVPAPVPYPISLISSNNIIMGNYPVITASGANTWNICLVSIIENPEGHPSVYPNPFNSYFIVDISSLHLQSPGMIYLYDGLGRLMQSQIINDGAIRIERGNLLPGIYFYRITHEGKVIHTGKVVAE